MAKHFTAEFKCISRDLMVRRLNRIFIERLTMNFIAHHPFNDGVSRESVCEKAVFDVFLTRKLLFRRTDPEQASAAIAFSPFHAAFLTTIPLHACRPERRQSAADLCRGCIRMDRYPESPSSAPRIPVSPVFHAPASAVLHTPGAAGGWPESRSNAPS